MRLADGSLRTTREAMAQYPEWAVTRTWELPNIPVTEPDEDLESYLRRIGFTDAHLDYTQRAFAGASGEIMSRLSAKAALQEMHDTTAGSGDFRILDGYSRILDTLAEGLTIHLNTVVDTVEWGGESVTVTDSNGNTYTADQVVITLPLGVLQAGKVRFSPELPETKQTAIHGLQVSPVIKMVYRFNERVLPEGIMALYSDRNPCMWWSPSFGHPDAEGQVITAFVTAARAREMLALGEDAALQAGLRVLEAELGHEGLQPAAMRVVNWVEDPYSLGGYTSTPPNGTAYHAALAQPVAHKLYWAGEATANESWKATVHGAYASGRRAADEILNRQ